MEATMTFTEIRKIPTTIDLNKWEHAPGGIHQSVFRSYHIVGKIIEMCEQKVSHEIMLEIIADLMSPVDSKEEPK